MIGHIPQGAKGGVLAKHTIPNFPRSKAELERLLGVTISRAYGCQEASGTLADLNAVSALTLAGTGGYRKPMNGLQEFGVSFTDSDGRFSAAEADTYLPGTNSFLVLLYESITGTGANVVGSLFGLLDLADGLQFLNMMQQYTEDRYRSQLHDGTNLKNSTVSISPRDKVPRVSVVYYDAGDGNLYTYVSGQPLVTQAMGTWAGLSGASVASPTTLLGSWPGGANTAGVVRYAVYATGATLDNKGASLAATMRRFGWQ